MKTPSHSRRRFLKRAGLTVAALGCPFVARRNVLGANERLNIAGIGVGGKGSSDVGNVDHENIVALCDVDEAQAAGTFKKYPRAKRFNDYRVMLEKEGRSIDAVTISTPDHMHAPAAILAMRMGKHVYCQKPLTHTVREARQLTLLARRHRVATQMGNQGHAHPHTRRLVELIQAGVLGKVRQAHVWTDRPIWPQGIDRPAETPPVPATLDWDLWLGVAPWRPYHPAYVPFKWRGFWDFGTGALGDMACHCMDLVFFALQLGGPTSVEAQCSSVNNETAPAWSIITYEFPARGDWPAVKMVWYDGGKKPSPDWVKGRELPGNGVILVGDKDTLFVPSYWGGGAFLSGAKLEDFKSVPETLPKGGVDDFEKSHHQEWLNACKGGPPALSNFDYAGPMTEAVLLGNVALRVGQKIQWDAKKFKVTNVKAADHYLHKEYRKGWKV